MCRGSSKSKWRFKRLVNLEVFKCYIFTHVQWNVLSVPQSSRLFLLRESLGSLIQMFFIVCKTELFILPSLAASLKLAMPNRPLQNLIVDNKSCLPS